MKRTVLTLLSTLVLLVATMLSATPAQAGLGRIWATNVCASDGAYVQVRMLSQTLGVRIAHLDPCEVAGERTGNWTHWEPRSYRIPPGWSGRVRFQQHSNWSSWVHCAAASAGCFRSIYPGSTYEGDWHTDIQIRNF